MKPTSRHFGLLDLMILILSLAPGMGFLRWSVSEIQRHWQEVNWSYVTLTPWQGSPSASVNRSSIGLGLCILFFFFMINLVFPSIEILLLRLRRPHPPVLAFINQPGTLGCLASLLGIALSFMFQRLTNHTFVIFMLYSGPAVAVILAWTFLSLSRRFHPEPTWIDRFGRVLCVGWITFPLCITLTWLLFLNH